MPTLEINKQTLQVFEGATVVDAIRSYLALQKCSSSLSDLEVRDRFGNKVDMQGAITEGVAFTIQLKTSPKTQREGHRIGIQKQINAPQSAQPQSARNK